VSDKKLVPPSEEFWDAVIRAGSIVITCELCHREHFASGEPGHFDAGELEGLLEKAKKHPDQYIEHASDDSVSWGLIDGKQAVYDCQCNLARKYEDFIWSHRQVIARYLTKRIDDNLKEAKEEADSVKKLRKLEA
jgi:hypothetical protein